jgi:hypothetical protein
MLKQCDSPMSLTQKMMPRIKGLKGASAALAHSTFHPKEILISEV